MDPVVSLRAQKPILQSHWNLGNWKCENWSFGLIEAQNHNFANNYSENLSKYKDICETVLARESGP
jgi:hypothetical protein